MCRCRSPGGLRFLEVSARGNGDHACGLVYPELAPDLLRALGGALVLPRAATCGHLKTGKGCELTPGLIGHSVGEILVVGGAEILERHDGEPPGSGLGGDLAAIELLSVEGQTASRPAASRQTMAHQDTNGSHSWPQLRHLASSLPLIADLPGRPGLPHLGHGRGSRGCQGLVHPHFMWPRCSSPTGTVGYPSSGQVGMGSRAVGEAGGG
jgi:hypothetical protein